MLHRIFLAALAAQLGPCFEPQSLVTILVYDYASVEPAALDRMAATVTGLLDRAAIPSKWAWCRGTSTSNCPERPGPNDFLVRIIRNAPLTGLPSDVAGLSIVAEQGAYITVYAAPIIETAAAVGLRAGALLGYTVAHEIGHLLLGPSAHSRIGVMHGAWARADYEAMRQNWLVFRPEQARRMRHEIQRRGSLLAKSQ